MTPVQGSDCLNQSVSARSRQHPSRTHRSPPTLFPLTVIHRPFPPHSPYNIPLAASITIPHYNNPHALHSLFSLTYNPFVPSPFICPHNNPPAVFLLIPPHKTSRSPFYLFLPQPSGSCTVVTSLVVLHSCYITNNSTQLFRHSSTHAFVTSHAVLNSCYVTNRLTVLHSCYVTVLHSCHVTVFNSCYVTVLHSCYVTVLHSATSYI